MREIATNLLENRLPGLSARFGDAILDAEEFRGDLTVVVHPDKVREIIHYLKHDPAHRLEVMMDLFAMDYLKSKVEHPERFAVIYMLVNLFENRRVRLKAFLPEEKPEIPSIHDIYKAANWFEREAWDLYGITFKGHPNLIRILCHNEFEGHPLRKDYPSDRYQRLKTATTSTEL